MKKEWFVKPLALGIVVFFICMNVNPSFAFADVKKPIIPASDSNTLYVGGSGEGNYSKIQDAINDSSDEDTIFVYDDSSPYYENIFINKEIRVIGEDKNSTIIDGKRLDSIVKLTANNSSIEQFTLQNTTTYTDVIWIGSYHGVLVRNNIIKYHYTVGISCDGSFCELSYNFIQGIGGIGIDSLFTSNLFIHHNIIQGGSWGIRLGSNKCIIANNVINDTFEGLYFNDGCYANKIYDNVIMNNDQGVYLQNSLFNSFYRNSFIANDISASFLTQYFAPVYNRWVRNYWDDLGVLPVKRISGTWINIIGLIINRSNFDLFPARKPYDIGG